MAHLVVLALLLHVAAGDSVKAVSGFHGEAVTLHSGANPSWNISTIEWSILSNNTFIATYRSGQPSINRFWRYKDRLSLNTATGDLTIRNLSEEDAIEYNLYLIHRNQKLRSKTKLTVARRIQKPHLRKLLSGFVEGSCMMVMQCSSEGKAIEFSWQAQPSSSVTQSVCKNDSSVLVLSVHTEVSVTCTVHNGVENASAVDTVRCSEDKPKRKEKGGCSTGAVVLFIIVVFCGFCGGFCLGRVYKTSLLDECISKAFRRESNKPGGRGAGQDDLGNNNDKQGDPV